MRTRTGEAVTTTPMEKVLTALEARGSRIERQSDGSRMAQCTGHDDGRPSLHLTEEHDGKVLVHCLAGCRSEDVVTGMGLEMSDLFVSNSNGNGRARIAAPADLRPLRTVTRTEHVCDYIYTDTAGNPVVKVARFAEYGPSGEVVGKNFRQSRHEGGRWVSGLGGVTVPLYRLPEVAAAVTTGRPVLVVEGEKDADRAAEAGLVATTASGGAGKWRDHHTGALHGAHVVLVADDDDPGRRHAATVSEALSGVAASVTVYLPAEGCKDLSDHLGAGYDIGQLRPWVSDPPGPPTATVHSGPERRVVLTSAIEFTPARVRWGWRDRMPVGEICLIPGREGSGKSLFLAWLTAQLTRGTLPGEFEGEPRAVVYCASEDSWNYTIVPRMLAANADLKLVYRADALGEGPLNFPLDCDAIAEAALEVDAAALMLDPIVSLIDDRLSVNQARELRQALEPLRRAAERARVFVPALAHFNKTTDTDVLSKIPGARAWAEVARAGVAVAKEGEGNGYVMSQIKNNLGRLDLPNLRYLIKAVDVDTPEGPAEVGQLVWDGESDTSVEAELARRPDRPGRDLSDTTEAVVRFVNEQGFPLPVADIHARFPNVKRDTISAACRRAYERGDLSRPCYGHYGPAGPRTTEGVTP
jgi:hypothetical protein